MDLRTLCVQAEELRKAAERICEQLTNQIAATYASVLRLERTPERRVKRRKLR